MGLGGEVYKSSNIMPGSRMWKSTNHQRKRVSDNSLSKGTKKSRWELEVCLEYGKHTGYTEIIGEEGWVTLDDWDKGFRFCKERKRTHKRTIIQTHKVESSFPLVVNLFKTRNFEGFSNKTVILIIIVTVNITTTNIS